jgi:hypothetical protein
MVAVATTLPCGYSGIEAELSIAHNSNNNFTSTDLGRWESWLESLAGHTAITGPGNTVLVLSSDVLRFFSAGGDVTERTETATAAAAALGNTNAGIGIKAEIEIRGGETYTFDGVGWTNVAKSVSQQYFQLECTDFGGEDDRPIRRSTGSRADASSSSFDECRASAILSGAIVRIKRR